MKGGLPRRVSADRHPEGVRAAHHPPGPAPSGFRGLPPRTRGAGERRSPSADTRPPWRPSSGARHRRGSRPAPLRGVVEPEVDLLQGRIARRGAWQRRGPLAQMLEDLAHHRGLGGRRDHAHLPAALGHTKTRKAEGPLHHQRPVEAPRPGEQRAVLQTPRGRDSDQGRIDSAPPAGPARSQEARSARGVRHDFAAESPLAQGPADLAAPWRKRAAATLGCSAARGARARQARHRSQALRCAGATARRTRTRAAASKGVAVAKKGPR